MHKKDISITRYFSKLPLLLLLVLLTDCSKESLEPEVNGGKLIITETKIYAPWEESIQSAFITSASGLRFEIQEEWLKIMNSEDFTESTQETELMISILENINDEGRTATIKIFSEKGFKDSIQVVQDGVIDIVPELLSFGFLLEHNPEALLSSLEFTADFEENDPNTPIEINLPTNITASNLIPFFKFRGERMEINGEEFLSGITSIDFNQPITVTVYSILNKINYTIKFKRHNGLPVLYIETENNANILSKDIHINGVLTIEETDASGQRVLSKMPMKIKGRGNSTWDAPKKSYKIKLDKKEVIFGMPRNKHWVLLANHFDLTTIRNEIAFSIGRMSSLAWTPGSQFVELYLNGSYKGSYQLCEHIRIDEDRVNVTDEGFLLEVDQLKRLNEEDVYFKGTNSTYLFNIKGPDVSWNSTEYNWIKNYINEFEEVLYGKDFNHPEKGYRKYIDVESFIDWYWVNEICKNGDAAFFSSCFMHIKPGEKLKMGPIWDFDLAFGNHSVSHLGSPEEWWITNVRWYRILFRDPEFLSELKNRFYFYLSHKEDILQHIVKQRQTVELSVVENDFIWNRLAPVGSDREAILNGLDTHQEFLWNFLDRRFAWMAQAIEELQYTNF